MFFLDHSNNALEFKSFKDETQIFRPYEKKLLTV
jgi:extradiol dioxygenase family protein